MQENVDKIIENSNTIAVVGFSSKTHKAGYYVPAYLQEQGYRIIPVNPYMDEALGEKAYPDLPSIPDPVDLVLIFQRSENVPPFVEQAIEIEADSVWLQLGIVHQSAMAEAQAAGLDTVMNKCMLVEHKRWRRQNP